MKATETDLKPESSAGFTPTHGSAIPETVILDMKTKAYERKDAVRKMRNETANQKATADRYQKATEFAERQLGEIADFLQLHNADAMKSGVTWRDVLGVPNAEVSEGGTRDSRIETAAKSRPSLH